MDPKLHELPAPYSETPRERSLMVKTLRALAIVVGITLLGGVGYVLLLNSPGRESVEAISFVAGHLGVGVPAANLAVFAWFAMQGTRLRARGEGLDLFEDVRSPVGTTMLVRGQLNGRTVRIFRDRVEVDVACPAPGIFQGKVLTALGKVTDGKGPTPATRTGARGLSALGVERLEIEAGRLIVYGGSALAIDLVPHELEIALAPATIRFNPGQAPSGRNCPYCHQELGPLRLEPAVRCPSCDSQHHSECWQEHGGCAVFRCRRAPSPDRERPAPDIRIRERT